MVRQHDLNNHQHEPTKWSRGYDLAYHHVVRRRLLSAIVGAVLLIVCMGLGGCASSSDATEPDHTPPKHKPATFREAIDEIGRRHERLIQSSKQSPSTTNEQDLTELLDIIGWLPELAADSAMKKPEWDRANAASKTLLSLYQFDTQSTKSSPTQRSVDGERVIKLCNDLKSISDSVGE